jgi:hypothetical protein
VLMRLGTVASEGSNRWLEYGVFSARSAAAGKRRRVSVRAMSQ